MAENMMCKNQKASNDKYREGYDRIFSKNIKKEEGEDGKNGR